MFSFLLASALFAAPSPAITLSEVVVTSDVVQVTERALIQGSGTVKVYEYRKQGGK